MDKTMVLWTKLWYYTENYRTSIYEGNKHGKLQKTKKFWFIMKKKYGNIPKYLKLNRFKALKLWFTMEKIWYFGKTIVL